MSATSASEESGRFAYAIRGGEEGARRLDLLAAVMNATTEDLLDAAGVQTGMYCLDAGCGGGHVSRTLAARVGPRGGVVGIDFDPVKIEGARNDAITAGLHNVEFRVADLTRWVEPATFDVVYGRFIVSHLAGRTGFIARLYDALRPGGVLILEDVDFTGSYCEPANAAFARYCELYASVIARRGGDANAGSTLEQLCAEAGLRELRSRIVQPAHHGSSPEKRLSLSTLVNIAESAIADGLTTTREVEDLVQELTEFTDDEGSVIALPRVYQVWGRKSASEPSASSQLT